MATAKYLGGRISWLWLGLTVALFGPFYCGWTCPFGTISRLTSEVGKRFLPKFQFELPQNVKKYLPICKYLLFAMFIWVSVLPSLGITFGKEYLAYFKMHGQLKIISSIPLALIFANFYCRFFCWHKAQYNLFGLVSPCAIAVDKDKCVGCNSCKKACPMKLDITGVDKVKTDCVMCMQCIEACPLPDKAVGLTFLGKRVSPLLVAAAYFATYIVLVIGLKHL